MLGWIWRIGCKVVDTIWKLFAAISTVSAFVLQWDETYGQAEEWGIVALAKKVGAFWAGFFTEHWPLLALAVVAVTFFAYLVVGQPKTRLRREFDEKSRRARMAKPKKKPKGSKR